MKRTKRKSAVRRRKPRKSTIPIKSNNKKIVEENSRTQLKSENESLKKTSSANTNRRLSFNEIQSIYDAVLRYLSTSNFHLTKLAFLCEDQNYISCRGKISLNKIDYSTNCHKHVLEWFRYNRDYPQIIKEKNSSGIMVLKKDYSLITALYYGLLYNIIKPCLSTKSNQLQISSFLSIIRDHDLRMFDIFNPSVIDQKMNELKNNLSVQQNIRKKKHKNANCVLGKTVNLIGRLCYLCMSWSLNQLPCCCWHPFKSHLTVTNNNLMEFLSFSFNCDASYETLPINQVPSFLIDEAITCLEWNDSGNKLAIGTNKGNLTVYDDFQQVNDLSIQLTHENEESFEDNDVFEELKGEIKGLTWIDKDCFCFLLNERLVKSCTLKVNDNYLAEKIDLSRYHPINIRRSLVHECVAAYGTQGHVLVIRTLPNLVITHIYKTHNGMLINDCRFSNTITNPILASIGYDNSLRLYSLNKSAFEVEKSICGFKDYATCLDWAPNHSLYNILAVGSADGYLRVWHIINNYDIQYELTWLIKTTSGRIHKTEFARHGSLLATSQGHLDRSFVSIWDYSNKSLLYECKSWWTMVSQMIWNYDVNIKLLLAIHNNDSPDNVEEETRIDLLVINIDDSKSL